MEELTSRDQDTTTFYRTFNQQKIAPKDNTADEVIKLEKDALTSAIIARIYIRRSSQNYDQYRIQLYNGYIDGDKEYPVTMANANRRIEYHKLFKFLCKGEGNSTQYGQSGKAKPTDADNDGKEVDRS